MNSSESSLCIECEKPIIDDQEYFCDICDEYYCQTCFLNNPNNTSTFCKTCIRDHNEEIEILLEKLEFDTEICSSCRNEFHVLDLYCSMSGY